MKITKANSKLLFSFIITAITCRSLKKSYNKSSKIYDDLFSPQQQRIAKTIALYLKGKHKKNVLDLCCGTGILTRALSVIADKVTGVDYSDKMLEVAKAKTQAKNVVYIHKNILSFDEKSKFDVITMLGAFSHFYGNSLNLLIKKISCLMNTNSTVIIGLTPFPWNNESQFKFSLKNLIISVFYNLFMKINNIDERRIIYSIKKLTVLFEKHNLKMRYLKINGCEILHLTFLFNYFS